MGNLTGLIDYEASPENEYSLLPSGEYHAVIIDSEMKPTRNGSGEYLELVHQITDGPYKGKKLWARLNLNNPNPKAVSIAQQHLAQIRAATIGLGVRLEDSPQLHGIPMLIRVEYVTANEKRDRDGNEIKEWKKAEGVVPQASAPARPAANGSAPAWANRPAA